MNDTKIVNISGTAIAGGGERHHLYIRINESTADDVYNLSKNFWAKRKHQSDEKIKEITLDYRKSNFHDSMGPVRQKLTEIYAECTPERPFSMIDFGGASGSIFYVLKDLFPDTSVRYLLIDPFKPFIEDFQQAFPDQQAIEATAEQFIQMGDDAFEGPSYRMFFSAHVMYLIKPSVVREALKRAARLADEIVLVDNIMNTHGELDKENPIILAYYPEGNQFYFSHYFEGYFDDIGFEIVDVMPILPCAKEMKLGFGLIRARRR